MAYFVWADDMVIDNGPIDQDHQNLVDQVNQLHTATMDGRGHEMVEELLQALVHDTVEHIRREEHFMVQIGYPSLPPHQADHARFEGELRALQRQFEAGGITVAAQLSTLLRDWLSLHIRRYDKEIMTFMRQQKSVHRLRTPS